MIETGDSTGWWGLFATIPIALSYAGGAPCGALGTELYSYDFDGRSDKEKKSEHETRQSEADSFNSPIKNTDDQPAGIVEKGDSTSYMAVYVTFNGTLK